MMFLSLDTSSRVLTLLLNVLSVYLLAERDPGYWSSPHVVLCARRAAHLPALCGKPGLTSLWTTVRRYVSCPECIAEIERRLAARRSQTAR
jgi:hypothetical protein